MKNKRGQIEQVTQQPVVQKKSRWWLWLIIILVLVGIGIGLYFWLSGGSDGGALSNLGGSSIPSPPALPE